MSMPFTTPSFISDHPFDVAILLLAASFNNAEDCCEVMSGTGREQSWREKSMDQFILELMNLLQKDNTQRLHLLSAPRDCVKHNKVCALGWDLNITHGRAALVLLWYLKSVKGERGVCYSSLDSFSQSYKGA